MSQDKMPEMQEEVQVSLGAVVKEQMYTVLFTSKEGSDGEFKHCTKMDIMEYIHVFVLPHESARITKKFAEQIKSITITKENI